MNKVWYSIDQAVLETINALSLQDAKSVQSQVFPDIGSLTATQLPAVSICESKGPRRGDRSTGGNWRWYPVDVFVLDKTPTHDKKQTYLDLIEDIANAFDGQRLSGVTEVQFCEIDYEPAFDRMMPHYRHVVTGITLNFRVYIGK